MLSSKNPSDFRTKIASVPSVGIVKRLKKALKY